MGHNHHHSTNDGVSQRVNSPRFSGSMTRRAHSFKRNNNNNNGNSHTSISNNATPSTSLSPHCEIELQANSPRSEIGTNLVSAEVLEPVLERKHAHHVTQRVHGRAVKSFLKTPIEYFVVDLSLREKRKIGHWMFIVFCGMCLFLGVLKICATGWFGSAIERAESSQVSMKDASVSDFSRLFMSYVIPARSAVINYFIIWCLCRR